MSAHAILSASSASRWGICPRSVEGEYESKTSRVAAEGTLLHGVCESIIKGGKPPEVGSTHVVEGEEFTITKDMLDDCKVYVDYVKGRPWIGQYEVEGRVYYSRAMEVPRQTAWGTADCFGFTVDADGTRWLEIIDLKMGRKAVNPVRNPQAALYAAGVMEWSQDILIQPNDLNIRITICQPRLSRTPFSWETTAGEIRRMCAELRPAGQAAVRFARGEATDVDHQQFPETPGEHCLYCRRKQDCTAFTNKALHAGRSLGMAFNLELFKMRDAIRAHMDDLERTALQSAMAGHPYEGTKLVEGRKGSPKLRVTYDELRVIAKKYGVESALVALQEVWLTPAKIRDTLVKVGVPPEVLADLIETTPPAPTLASANDPRREYQLPQNDTGFTGVAAPVTNPFATFNVVLDKNDIPLI